MLWRFNWFGLAAKVSEAAKTTKMKGSSSAPFSRARLLPFHNLDEEEERDEVLHLFLLLPSSHYEKDLGIYGEANEDVNLIEQQWNFFLQLLRSCIFFFFDSPSKAVVYQDLLQFLRMSINKQWHKIYVRNCNDKWRLLVLACIYSFFTLLLHI